MFWLRKGVWTVVAVATFVVLVRTFPAMSSTLAMVLVVAMAAVALYGLERSVVLLACACGSEGSLRPRQTHCRLD